MKLNIKGKNINVYESLKEEAKEKFDRLQQGRRNGPQIFYRR